MLRILGLLRILLWLLILLRGLLLILLLWLLLILLLWLLLILLLWLLRLILLRWLLLILLRLLNDRLHLRSLRLHRRNRLRHWLLNCVPLRAHSNRLHWLLRHWLLNRISLRVQWNWLRLARSGGRSKLRLCWCVPRHRLRHWCWLEAWRSHWLLRECLRTSRHCGIWVRRVECLAQRLHGLGRLVDGGQQSGKLVSGATRV